MTLLKRILLEQRTFILPLVIVAIANVGAYVLVVRPLEVKSAGVANRAVAAKDARLAAERDAAAARALVSGKTLAEQELSTFYDKVVPADLPSARRLTYATLPALARKVNVKYEQRHTEVNPPEKGSRLARLTMQMQLQGSYAGLRQFIYEIETAPQFVIIDDVSIAQSDPAQPLLLTIAVSTYYKQGAEAHAR
jgi:hypothetical protein